MGCLGVRCCLAITSCVNTFFVRDVRSPCRQTTSVATRRVGSASISSKLRAWIASMWPSFRSQRRSRTTLQPLHRLESLTAPRAHRVDESCRDEADNAPTRTGPLVPHERLPTRRPIRTLPRWCARAHKEQLLGVAGDVDHRQGDRGFGDRGGVGLRRTHAASSEA